MASFYCEMFFPLPKVLTYRCGILDQSLKKLFPESSLNNLDGHCNIIYLREWVVQPFYQKAQSSSGGMTWEDVLARTR